jgi:hypothetical protein
MMQQVAGEVCRAQLFPGLMTPLACMQSWPQGIKGLQSLVPACLTAACPALRTLTIRDCEFEPELDSPQQQVAAAAVANQGDASASVDVIAPTLQLQTLHLGDCYDPPVHLLSTALASLPYLTTLTLPAQGSSGGDDISTALAASTGQLTRLAWVNLDGYPKSPSFLAAPAVQNKLARLQQLDLSPFDLDDAGLSAMMAYMPALTHVEVLSLELQDNHADSPLMVFSWEQLFIRCLASATMLARLPLRCIKRVVAWGVECEEDTTGNSSKNGTTLAATFAAALASAPDCRFACRGTLRLFCSASQLPAMLPLLARWEGVWSLWLSSPGRSSDLLTPAAVSALGALLEGMPSCTKLNLHGYAPSPSAPLLPVLTRTSVVALVISCSPMTEAQMMMCCTGSQPGRAYTVKLRGSGDFFRAAVANVRASLAQAGSAVQLVTD